MSGFALFADSVRDATNSIPTTKVTDTPAFEGFLRGTGMAFVREGLAKPARAMSMLGAAIPVAVDAVTGGTRLQDDYFRIHEGVYDRAVKFWTPEPGEVGVAAEMLGGLTGVLGQIILSPQLAVASQFLSQAEDLITQPGVTSRQALGVGAAQAIGLGVGIWAPPALGYSLATKAATGAGVNLLQGIITRGASSAILGDNPAAQSFPAFGGTEMLFDTLLGAAFGSAAHYVPRWKAEVERVTDAALAPTARSAIKAGAGDITRADLAAGANLATKRIADAIDAWGKNATPTEQAAMATLRVAKHLNADSMPGRPTGPGSVEVHVAAMREAIQSLLNDQPVTARVVADDGRPLPADNTQPATQTTIAQARQELEQGQPGLAYQELAETLAEPPGPRRSELLGNLRPDLARAQEPPADPAEARLWNEIHRPDPTAPATQIADLTAAVRSWNPETPPFHVERPLFTPEPTTRTEQRLAALEQEAARIAAQEGLPPKPPDPVDMWVSREVQKAGRPPEEAQAAGAMWKAAFESFGRAAGVDPTQLFYRYMDRVVGYGAAQPDAATTLMQAGTRPARATPADNIDAYKPQVGRSQVGDLPYFKTGHVAMGKPSVARSRPATGGDRMTWLIYDTRAGQVKKVGFVIADYDKKTGTFLALRNIEIKKDTRTTGLGEATVAMMLAHNGKTPMRIEDITHAGVQGTPDDALPFWRKMGTMLDNYSSDPGVAMNGRVSLADYLGARRGRGTAEGRAGDAAPARGADPRGAEGAGGGGGRADGTGTLFQSGYSKELAAELKFKKDLARAEETLGRNLTDAEEDALIRGLDERELAEYEAGKPASMSWLEYARQRAAGIHPDYKGLVTHGEVHVTHGENSPWRETAAGRDLDALRALRSEAVALEKDSPAYFYIEEDGSATITVIDVRDVPPEMLAFAEKHNLKVDVVIHPGMVATRAESTMPDKFRASGARYSMEMNRLYQSGTGSWYYSALSAAIDAAPPRAQNAGTWKQWLQAQINAGRIKESEVEWTGIREFLDTQEGKIGPDQLRAYMEQGGVRVEEVELGKESFDTLVPSRIQMEQMSTAELARRYEELNGEAPPEQFARQDLEDYFVEYATDERNVSGVDTGTDTRFARWQLPGAKEGSYREIALVLPRRAAPGHSTGKVEFDPMDEEYPWVIMVNGREVNRSRQGGQIADDILAEMLDRENEFKTPSNNYRVPPGHSMGDKADTNRIAHIRFNERTGPNGERVLFIEEIQSDWAQQGKKSGFSDEMGDAISSAEHARAMDLQRRSIGGEVLSPDEHRELVRLQEQHGRSVAGGKIPPGPFVKKTEAWVGLVMKRMIRYAAENGFDHVAWTTGAQQADRYDLSKQVREIAYDKKPDGTYHVSAESNAGTIITLGDSIQEKDLPDHVGKELAQKIAEGGGDQRGGWKIMSGLNLKVGGEGMRGFYDKIVPSVAKDVLKKLGGGKVEQIELRNQREDFDYGDIENATPEELAQLEAGGVALTQQGITITPEVKAKAMQAQALFQRAGHMSPHTFNSFDHSYIGKGEGAQVYGWGTYLWTNRSVGEWYYNNFRRAAERDAQMVIRSGPFDPKWFDAKGFSTPEARATYTEPQITAMSEVVGYLDEGKSIADAQRETIQRLSDIYGDDQGRGAIVTETADWLRNQITTGLRSIGPNDDPAYKTPDGRMVHASQAGDNKAMADAIGQVAEFGYARAALTFDNLIASVKTNVADMNKDLQKLIDEVTEEMSSPTLEAHRASEIGKSVWGDVAPDEANWTVMDGADVRSQTTGRDGANAIERYRADRTAVINRWKERQAANDQRVTDLQHTRHLVDEITQPNDISHLEFSRRKNGSWKYDNPSTGVTRSGFGSKEEALQHAISVAGRSLKPGYEVVRLTPKPVRKYTVEAPENDILIDWSKTVGEQPKPVLEALERGGVKVITKAEIEQEALSLWEMERELHRWAEDRAQSEDEREAVRADMLAQPHPDSTHYTRAAEAKLLDDYFDDDRYKFGVPETEDGRSLYVRMMAAHGYRGGPLDGPNTQYAAQASQTFAEMGIPGHRYLDGGSRRRDGGTYNLVIYDDKAMQIVHMEQTRERGFLQIGDERKMLIGLTKDADASTFMHESAHFFLEVMDDLSTTVPTLKADMEVLFQEWGIDRGAWDQMDLNAKRPYHEMFAESFEVYLMSNKAPTPELRSVFQRFRDWLLDIYKVATATGRKVSQPMRDLFDRMLDAQRREPATTQASQPAEGAPPPPPPEVGPAPGVVDQFDFQATGEPVPPEPLTLESQAMRDMIRDAVEREAGWYQIGGRHMGGDHGIPNFSEWIPNGPWWTGRPDKKMNDKAYFDAVSKALLGQKMKPMEQRAVAYLLDHLNKRRVDEWKAARAEWDQLSQEVVAEGLEPTKDNVIDVDAVARATEIDEAAVERLAMQYDADDVGFMAEIRRMIDAQQNPTIVQGSEGGAAAAPEAAAAGNITDGRGDGQPAQGRKPGADRQDAVDPLAAEAARVAVENPSLVLHFDQPDGTSVRMTVAEYLERTRMEADLARQDVALLEEATACMFGAMS